MIDQTLIKKNQSLYWVSRAFKCTFTHSIAFAVWALTSEQRQDRDFPSRLSRHLPSLKLAPFPKIEQIQYHLYRNSVRIYVIDAANQGLL